MNRNRIIAVVVVVGAVFALSSIFGTSIGQTTVAVLAIAIIVRIGLKMIGGLADPIPEPLEAGLLRKVKLVYRCSICGAEVRMTVAPTEDPEAPRHCLEDMELVTPIE